MTQTNTYEIWNEGYCMNSDSSPAQYLGTFNGKDFKDACFNCIKSLKWDERYYNKDNNTYWGCRFFDNEPEARKSFG